MLYRVGIRSGLPGVIVGFRGEQIREPTFVLKRSKLPTQAEQSEGCDGQTRSNGSETEDHLLVFENTRNERTRLLEEERIVLGGARHPHIFGFSLVKPDSRRGEVSPSTGRGGYAGHDVCFELPLGANKAQDGCSKAAHGSLDSFLGFEIEVDGLAVV